MCLSVCLYVGHAEITRISLSALRSDSHLEAGKGEFSGFQKQIYHLHWESVDGGSPVFDTFLSTFCDLFDFAL